MKRKLMQLMLVGVLAVSFAVNGIGVAAAKGNDVGAVYTLTNSATGNEVAIFNRAADGTLTAAGTVSTGGLGTGAGLGSQGALTLSKNGKWLFAVNAGSDDVSVFAVSASGLTLVDKVASGGDLPISVTNHKNLVYVLNAGGSGNITGFTLNKRGKLAPIAGSTRNLSNNGVGAAPGPAQIEFSPDGEVLVVTEKATNLIDTYAVDEDGLAGSVTTDPSNGVTPFGFEFSKRGTLIVSEAFGGAVNASAASSYDVSDDEFESISASVPTNQTAACWVVVTKNGKYAYTTNAGSGSISAYRVSRDGSISLLHAQAGLTGDGSTPIDAALSGNSQYLYTLNAGAHTITGFAVSADGGLNSLGGVSGLIAGAAGLAAW